MNTGYLWRARCGGTRTPGSEGGPGNRTDPKGRQRAPARPYLYALERRFTVWLCNAPNVKKVPGRKSDLSDAEWLADVAAHGMIRPSFVPPLAIRELRELTRYRKT
jgi:transposase